jgi:YidC/Oxa1 family membrane protein insertase
LIFFGVYISAYLKAFLSAIRIAAADMPVHTARRNSASMRHVAPLARDSRVSQICRLGAIILAGLLIANPALAIPSPDIVVSFFSNSAQLLALLTAVVGSAAVSRARNVREPGRTAAASRWSVWLTRGLVLVLLGSLGANVLQWSGDMDSRTTRLSTNLTRSSTEAGRAVGDTSLKTLPFSRQINHPQGITGDRLAQLLEQREAGAAPGVNFIDVREPEEWEAGNLSTFSHVRYPELLRRIGELRLKKGKNVLLCHSGNRSSELCGELKKRGIDCSFVVGGYEKWLAEGRTINTAEGAEPQSLRPLPSYPNSDVLLDTPEVQELVSKSPTLFIDVRYPKDFERAHLPGAINLPLRKMRTADMDAAFKKLPKRPVIAPCYDKRSCFYAQILGLRLHRLGFDFLGRYTVPHEYFVAGNQRPHVAAWAEAKDSTILGKIQQPFETALRWFHDKTGSLVLAIFLVVALLRLALLPLTVKGERDQVVEQRLRPRLAELKARLAEDPQRYQRAMRRLMDTNGITPMRNLFGLIVQVVLLLVLISAVAAVARPGSESFFWIPDIGEPDPLYLASITLGVMVFAHLQFAAVRKTFRFLSLRLLSGLFFTLITFELSAALNLYLVIGIGLMLLQAAVIRRVVGRTDARSVKPHSSLPERIADLRDADRIPGAGRKAERLALMMRHGLPVPNGFVVPNGVFTEDGSLQKSDRKTLESFRKQHSLEAMAVRSSGLSEDGEDRSYAGQFDTMLNVNSADLFQSTLKIFKTLNSAPAEGYGNGDTMGGGVIVQKMVDAEFAGILFTEHPMHSGATLVEMTSGLGDELATGTAEADAYQFGRRSHLPLDAEEPPIDLHPLLELGKRVEQMFDQPQDIEWAYKDGRFYLLQTRNITVLGRLQDNDGEQAAFERERNRLLEIAKDYTPDMTAFAQNELSELLPQPTPLSLDLMQALWQPGGSVDLACRSLGVPYDVPEDGRALLVSVFGRLYIDDPAQRARVRKGMGPIATFQLSRAAEQLEHDFTHGYLPALMRDLLPREAMDLSVLATPDLVTLFEDTCDRYVRDSHVQVDIINIAADFFVKSAERQFHKKGVSASSYLGHGAKTIVHQAMSLLHQVREGNAKPEEFLAIFGHRAPIDYELAQPRYQEDLGLMENLIRNAASDPVADDDMSTQAQVPSEPTLALAVTRARKFQALKEEAKHYSLRELTVLRQILVELDSRFALDGNIFYLHLDEIPLLRNPEAVEELQERANERRRTDELFESFNEPPASLTLKELELLSVHGGQIESLESESGDLRGTLVAGDTEVTGTARVLTDQNIDTIQDGDIVVARYMHPNWTPILPRLKGIVTEVGGWLSHTSILAREYNVTTITGIKNAEYRIQTGDVIRLKLDGTIEYADDGAAAAKPDQNVTESTDAGDRPSVGRRARS